jgi:hypothetical protein
MFSLTTLSIPKKEHGILDTTLFLGKGEKQPLIVWRGGGGNDWSRDHAKVKRDSLNNQCLISNWIFHSKWRTIKFR